MHLLFASGPSYLEYIRSNPKPYSWFQHLFNRMESCHTCITYELSNACLYNDYSETNQYRSIFNSPFHDFPSWVVKDIGAKLCVYVLHVLHTILAIHANEISIMHLTRRIKKIYFPTDLNCLKVSIETRHGIQTWFCALGSRFQYIWGRLSRSVWILKKRNISLFFALLLAIVNCRMLELFRFYGGISALVHELGNCGQMHHQFRLGLWSTQVRTTRACHEYSGA